MTAEMALARLHPSVRVEPSELQPGERGRIVVTLDIPNGCHVQSHTPNEPFLIPTTIHLDRVPVAGFGPAVYPPVEIERFDWTPVELEVHRGTVDIVVPVEIAPDAGTGEVAVTGHVRYQACTEAACLPPVEERIEARVNIQAVKE